MSEHMTWSLWGLPGPPALCQAGKPRDQAEGAEASLQIHRVLTVTQPWAWEGNPSNLSIHPYTRRSILTSQVGVLTHSTPWCRHVCAAPARSGRLMPLPCRSLAWKGLRSCLWNLIPQRDYSWFSNSLSGRTMVPYCSPHCQPDLFIN